MTETAPTSDVNSLVPATLAPPRGATIALIEIWRRPDVGFPSTFCRSVRPKARVWAPELHEPVIHREQGRAQIIGIREVTDEPPVYSVEFIDGELTGKHGEFEAAEFRERFIPVKLPALEFEYSEWEGIDSGFAKQALRLKRYTLVEFPGVEWAARPFESDRATQADYDRVIQLRNEARASRRPSKGS